MALECRVPAAVEGTQINHHGAAFGEVSVYKSEELESKLRKVSEMRRPWVAMDPLRRILISIFPSSPAKLTQILTISDIWGPQLGPDLGPELKM